jgi:SWI/SNF-related matrix-associated actin-dependent regulator 1 of chromatin subfamily A
MQSGLRVSTPMSDSDTPSSPIGFGSSTGPQRVSLSRNGSSGVTPFSAAVSTPDRVRYPGSASTSSNETLLNPDRLRNIFNKLPLEVIEDTIIRYGDELPVEIMKRLRAANEGVPYRAPGVASVKTIKPVATRSPVPLHASGSGSSFTSPIQIAASQRKNTKAVSAIYANRSERKATQLTKDTGASSPTKSEVEDVKKQSQQERATTISDDEAVTDDDSDVEGGRKGKGKMEVDEDGQDMDEVKALEVFNTCTAETLTGTIGTFVCGSFLKRVADLELCSTVCSAEQAEIIISLRPFATVEELKKKLTKRKGVSFGLFEQYIEVIQGYIEVDRCLTKCENIGKDIAEIMEIWTGSSRDNRSRTSTPDVGSTSGGQQSQDTGLHVTSVDVEKIKAEIMTEQDKKRRATLKTFVTEQPKTLAEGVVLKDYQLLGVNWLNLLYSKDLSCILADDMGELRVFSALSPRANHFTGLGKTMQVISFLTLLREKGKKGPHLIIVP